MKEALFLLACLFAFAASKPADDASVAKFLLRSCDRTDDNALNAAEFAGCISHASWQTRMDDQGLSVSRGELLQSFMDNADTNNDLRADEKELEEWSSRWFLSGLFGSGSSSGTVQINFSAVLNIIVKVLQFISQQKYSEAVAELYLALAGSELPAAASASISLAIQSITAGKYAEAVGLIYLTIRDMVGGDSPTGIFLISSTTVTNAATLLQAVIQNDSTKINLYIYKALAGLMVDFSGLSQESAGAVAALIQSIIENNTDEFYLSLTVVIDAIPGISTETATAIVALLEAVYYKENDKIATLIFGVLSSVFKEDGAAEIAQIFVAVIQAVMDGNSTKAIEQMTLLYSVITSGTQKESKFTSETVVTFTMIISALKEKNSAVAIAEVKYLLSSSSSQFSASQITSLNAIIASIEKSDYTGATAALVAIATSSSSSSISKVSVEVFVALSSIITLIEDDKADEAVLELNAILVDTSLKLSDSIKGKLKKILIFIAEGNTVAGVVEVSAVLTGAKVVYTGRLLTAKVSTELKTVVTAINAKDSKKAIAVIKALLEGKSGGDSLSASVKGELQIIVTALEKSDSAGAFAQLTVILVGQRSSTVSTSSTSVLLVALQEVSSGSSTTSVTKLEALLKDDKLDGKLKGEITAIVQSLKDKKNSKAMTAIVVSLLGSKSKISSKGRVSLLLVLGFVISGDFEGSISAIEALIAEEGRIDADVRLLLMFSIQLLKDGNSQGALAIVNTIITKVKVEG